MKIHVTLNLGEQPRTLELRGRLAWTMLQLSKAGQKGVTPIERPAPRWSGYVFDLRSLGVPIETEMVRHGGDYPGRHARYRLACGVSLTVLQGSAAA